MSRLPKFTGFTRIAVGVFVDGQIVNGLFFWVKDDFDALHVCVYMYMFIDG